MRTITVPVGERAYPIRIGNGLLAQVGVWAREVLGVARVALVQDAAVAELYGATVRESLEAAGIQVHPVSVPPGEGSKSLEELSNLYTAFSEARLDRKSAVAVLGGGVAGDLAGFAAASYLRGIPFVQVPTTLLAQVDSSVGGKTGIDLPAGKNLVGAFHQPSLVVVDLDTLATLSEREFVAGLAEVIKYGVIADAELFRYLEEHRPAILGRDPEALTHIIARSCEIKAEVVGADERESGLRAILNYGHTVGHSIEAVAGFGVYAHGEAVAMGMVAAGELSARHAGLERASEERIRRLVTDYGLPVRLNAPLPEAELLQAMLLDKKTVGGELRFVLAREIGSVHSQAVPREAVQAVLGEIAPE